MFKLSLFKSNEFLERKESFVSKSLSLSLYLKLEINFRALRFPKEFSMETAEMVLAALTEIMLIAILLLCFLKLYVVHDLVKAKKFQMPGKPRRLFVKNTY